MMEVNDDKWSMFGLVDKVLPNGRLMCFVSPLFLESLDIADSFFGDSNDYQ